MKLNFLFLTKFLVACFLAFCAFGFVACSDDDDGPSVDSKVVGIWTTETEDGKVELNLKSDGTWETDGAKGTFSTSGSNVTIVITHVGYGGKWYTKAELKKVAGDYLSDDDLNEMFAPQTARYSVNGNELTLTYSDASGTYQAVYTKK
jgi:hypothetical protein